VFVSRHVSPLGSFQHHEVYLLGVFERRFGPPVVDGGCPVGPEQRFALRPGTRPGDDEVERVVGKGQVVRECLVELDVWILVGCLDERVAVGLDGVAPPGVVADPPGQAPVATPDLQGVVVGRVPTGTRETVGPGGRAERGVAVSGRVSGDTRRLSSPESTCSGAGPTGVGGRAVGTPSSVREAPGHRSNVVAACPFDERRFPSGLNSYESTTRRAKETSKHRLPCETAGRDVVPRSHGCAPTSETWRCPPQ
jgi:hypothetical protein